jgi:hypothetical protein
VGKVYTSAELKIYSNSRVHGLDELWLGHRTRNFGELVQLLACVKYVGKCPAGVPCATVGGVSGSK